MESAESIQLKEDMISFEGFRNTVLEDYKTAMELCVLAGDFGRKGQALQK